MPSPAPHSGIKRHRLGLGLSDGVTGSETLQRSLFPGSQVAGGPAPPNPGCPSPPRRLLPVTQTGPSPVRLEDLSGPLKNSTAEPLQGGLPGVSRPSHPCPALPSSPESSGPTPGPHRRESERPVPERASHGPAAGPSPPQSASQGRREHSRQLSGDKATIQAGLAGTSCPPSLPPWRDPSGLPEHRLSPRPRPGLWEPARGQDPLEGLLALGA